MFEMKGFAVLFTIKGILMKKNTNNKQYWLVALTIFGVLAWTSFPVFNYFTAEANSFSDKKIMATPTPTPTANPNESPNPSDPKSSPSPTPFPTPTVSPTPFPSVTPVEMPTVSPSPSPTMQP